MRALTVLLLASVSFAAVSLMMESIVVSAKPQAPFTLTLEEEHRRT
jgi:hypothetical protein